MNSSEQKNFENLSPVASEIEWTAGELRRYCEEKADHPNSAASTEGYREALRILMQGKHQYSDISPSLRSDTAKAVAVLAVDYLNGECSREALLAGAARLL